MEMTFTQFLVSKGLVSAEAMAEALTVQLESTPVPQRVAIDRNLMTPKQLWTVLSHQEKHQSSFTEACLSTGALAQAGMDEVSATSAAQRRSLGQILLESGALTAEALLNAVDQFAVHSTQPQALQEIPPPHPGKDRQQIASSYTQPSTVTPVSLQVPEVQVAPLEPALVAEFIQLASPQRLEKLRQQFNDAQAGAETDTWTAAASHELSTIRAGATFVGATHIKRLCGALIETLRTQSSMNFGHLHEALQVLLALRQSIAEQQSEERLLQDSAFKCRHDAIIRILEDASITTSASQTDRAA